MMMRWIDPDISLPAKLGDLDLNYDVLVKVFPFDRLLLDAEDNPKEVKRFINYCLRNFQYIS